MKSKNTLLKTIGNYQFYHNLINGSDLLIRDKNPENYKRFKEDITISNFQEIKYLKA